MVLFGKYHIRKGSIAWWVVRLLPWAAVFCLLGAAGRSDLADYCRMHHMPFPY